MIAERGGDAFLARRLEERARRGTLRTLPAERPGLVDFVSNDYLGLVHTGRLAEAMQQAGIAVTRAPPPDEAALERLRSGDDIVSLGTAGVSPATGSTGSRLLSGTSRAVLALEEKIARFHGAEAGLIFNSGYDANVGLFSSIATEDDTVLYDERVHASIRDGIRLGRARSFPFRHNDLQHLGERLRVADGGNVWVAVETIYSMDGDEAPCTALAELCAAHGAGLILDEAHATGIYGRDGRGLAAATGIGDAAFARVHTFGKALGAHGAVVLGSRTLRDYLVNFAHSFIYSTALPPHSLLAIDCAYDLLPELEPERAQLRGVIDEFRARAVQARRKNARIAILDAAGPIQGLLTGGGPAGARALAQRLLDHGLDARPIVSPTVRRGLERVRIQLHAHNTAAEVARLFELIS